MLIGCPKEIKPQEFRVGLMPSAVFELTERGHQVMMETNAGTGAGFSDEDYTAVGAEIVATAKEVFDRADMIVKVKEPQSGERAMLREGQLLFTYLHLAPDPDQTHDLLNSGARQSHMKQSLITMVAFPYWPQCQRLQGVLHRRLVHGHCKRQMVAAASYWVVLLALAHRACWLSAVALLAHRRPRLQRAWARM